MLVSVIIPTRNRSALLALTLRSVLGQRDVDLEAIVVDEASTDETEARLAAVRDLRVRVIRHDAPLGLSAARNHGADEARGEWLAFIDDDDLWAPDKILRQLQAATVMDREWVYTGAVNIVGDRIVNGQLPLLPNQTVALLPRYNAIPGGGSNVIIKRSMWSKTGPFDTRFPAGGEDWEMSIRLAKRSLPARVCSPLVAKRLHSDNMSLNIRRMTHAAQLIEVLHHTEVDWGRMYRWFAYSCLRDRQVAAACGYFAKAACYGQARGVMTDAGAIVARKVARCRKSPHGDYRAPNPWIERAAAWLQEFGPFAAPLEARDFSRRK
jgi:glycosyltransferase involved in cell wall biosynthesis